MSGNGPVAAGSTALDLANQFAASGFTVLEPLAPVSAFGHEGHHMVVEVPEGCAAPTYQAWTGGGWGGRYYQNNGNVVEYWFLDVEGTPVMVEAELGRPEPSPEEDVAELQAVTRQPGDHALVGQPPIDLATERVGTCRPVPH